MRLASAAALALVSMAAGQVPAPAVPRATIPLRTSAVTVDGDLSEWAGAPTIALDREDQVWSQRRDPAAKWLGPADLEARFWLAYDPSRLWIGARIRDDGLVAGKVGAEWQLGDAIELFLDLDDSPATGTDVELMTPQAGRELYKMSSNGCEHHARASAHPSLELWS